MSCIVQFADLTKALAKIMQARGASECSRICCSGELLYRRITLSSSLADLKEVVCL